MEDFWSMPRRRSTEQTPSFYLKRPSFEKGLETPNLLYNSNNDDFSDVFGGPPRTLHLTRNLSGNNFFQDHIFKPAAADSMFHTRTFSSKKTGDIFRFADEDDDVRFRTRSQSRSIKSSSNELSPPRAEDSYSGFNSNLSGNLSSSRPVDVPGRWSPMPDRQKMQHLPFDGNAYAGKKGNYDANAKMMKMMIKMSYNNFGYSKRVLSPERGEGEFESFTNLKQVVEDYEVSSPPSSSAKSSVCQEEEVVITRHEDCLMSDGIDGVVEDEDDILGSYVIEINDFNCSGLREETAEAVGVDEAIAWAKEKYLNGIQLEKDQCIDHPGSSISDSSQMQMDEDSSASGSLGSDTILNTTENGIIETQKDEEQKAMELLDEGIRLWSAYKETNIQLLLSTLHHILWSGSGWNMVSLADIIDSAHVKKAYQKARLCLHPDKLQQRGATPLQKYIAAEAFSILQAAWEAFISRNSN